MKSACLNLEVNCLGGSYPIYIGQNLITNQDLWKSLLPGEQVLVVSHAQIADYYYPALERVLSPLAECAYCELPQGESYKTLQSFEQIIDKLVSLAFHRDAALIALGGGVIGDLTGFAAACYQRGIAYLQCPTTLLAQVDSSIGGKTAVNHSQGKNLIGTFYQPKGVMIDVNTLLSLPEREFKSGLAEVVKHALIADEAYLSMIETNLDAILAKDLNILPALIHRSCQIKANIVSQDEKEKTRHRFLLNFGHTLGHALEKALGYGMLLHGEAVAIGMMFALTLSHCLGYIPSGTVLRVKKLLERIGLPTRLPPSFSHDKFEALLQYDKKRNDQGVSWVILDKLGEARLESNISSDSLRKAFNLIL